MPAIAHAPFTVLHCKIKSMTSRSISRVKRLRGSAPGHAPLSDAVRRTLDL